MNLDAHLIRLSQGDMSKFEKLYNLTSQGIFHIILSYTNYNYSSAEDIMQETYITICKKANLYQPNTNAHAWMCKIAKNIALNHYTKASKHPFVDIDSMPQPTDFTSLSPDHEEPLLDIAAKVLTPEEYRILMLVEVDGYKRREVAQMMDMPISTVTWIRNQSLKKLKARCENYEK